MSTDLFARTLTPDECDRLIRRSRIRRAERAAVGVWIRYHLDWQMNNLSSGVEVGNAGRPCATENHAANVGRCRFGTDSPQGTTGITSAGVAPGHNGQVCRRFVRCFGGRCCDSRRAAGRCHFSLSIWR